MKPNDPELLKYYSARATEYEQIYYREVPARRRELAADVDLKELNRTKVDLERQLESAKVDLRPGHPTYEKNESELAKVRERIRDRVRVILGTLQNRYDGAREYAQNDDYDEDEDEEREGFFVDQEGDRG